MPTRPENLTEEELKLVEWIESQDYKTLLKKWRFTSAGDPLFLGRIGGYYSDVMAAKRKEIGHDFAVLASKRVGWDS